MNVDCGSWVISSKTGALYGHLVAGDPGAPVAYMIPAFQIFSDIENCLSGSISLPASRAFLELPNTAAETRATKSEEQVTQKSFGYYPSRQYIDDASDDINFENALYRKDIAPADMIFSKTIRYEDLLLNLMPQGVKIEEARLLAGLGTPSRKK